MRFDTTNWSVIVRATADESAVARDALASLCETYWPPVYALIRRKGHSPADAEDLTQAYFARFLEKGYVHDFRPELGRFRTFLRASVTHFLANEWDRASALKRGGGRPPISLDADPVEARYRAEPVDRLTPDVLFERQWAAALLERCLARLREEQNGASPPGRFDRLKPLLIGLSSSSGYATVAGELGLSESGVRVAVHRLRKRFCALLREEIARTVSDPADVDAEIRWLLSAVRAPGE